MADERLGTIARGKRGERGERGKRGHRGPTGPTGPSGSTLLGPTDGPGSLVASEDIPAGFVIAAGGSARLALADGSSLGNAIGIAISSTTVGASGVEYAMAGLVNLPGATWDSATGGSGGLVEGDAYYLSQTTPGHLTNIRPTSGQIVHVGTALGSTALDVQLSGFQFAGSTTVDVTGIGGGSVPIPLASDDVIAWITVNGVGTNTFTLPNGTVDGQQVRLVFINDDGTNPSAFAVTGAFFSGNSLLPFNDTANTGQCAADLVWRAASVQWLLTGDPLNIAVG